MAKCNVTFERKLNRKCAASKMEYRSFEFAQIQPFLQSAGLSIAF
jgi:hypothetical protein